MLFLRISAPFASFKHSYSREYNDTYPVPTPSTIYGCLLSLIGETNTQIHKGVGVAIALLSQPQIATVLRTMRRLKSKDINARNNSMPDYQSILCGLEIIVGVDSSTENNVGMTNLETRIQQALRHPETIDRFGGWSLGESRDLINSAEILPGIPDNATWLIKNNLGRYNLPVAVDYWGSKNTQRQKFSMSVLSSNVVDTGQIFCLIP